MARVQSLVGNLRLSSNKILKGEISKAKTIKHNGRDNTREKLPRA